MSGKKAFATRREFLRFLGQSTTVAATPSLLSTVLSGCSHLPGRSSLRSDQFLQPQSEDRLVLAPGLESRILLKWGDTLSAKGLRFGSHSDFCAYIPRSPDNPHDGVLMVNHESVSPLFASGFRKGPGARKTAEQVMREQEQVGVSLVRFFKGKSGWTVDLESPLNRRITGRTPIPILSEDPIEGKRVAQGTLANCAGGVTPWGTFLTCEENYDQFYGEWEYSESGKRSHSLHAKDLQWWRHQPHPPSHYGWVVEINPWTGRARKLTQLGRFAHEGATCARTRDGRVAVYLGDDTADEFLYKFVSARPDSLDSGTLYVAQLETGKWIPIKMDSHPDFRKRFGTVTELKVRTREAARLLMATPLDRPEDVEIHPQIGEVIVALSNNQKAQRPFGSLLKIQEKGSDPGALEFQSSIWISGGPESGLACPDNLAFDRSGNLWCTSDIADEKMNQAPYEAFKNNGLFFIPTKGAQAGQVFQVLSAPRDAEITGPMFTPDGETLLISVQHPGDQTEDLKKPTSQWPDGPGSIPKSAVVAVSGPGLRALVNYKG